MSVFLLTTSLSAIDTIFTMASTQLKDTVTRSCIIMTICFSPGFYMFQTHLTARGPVY